MAKALPVIERQLAWLDNALAAHEITPERGKAEVSRALTTLAFVRAAEGQLDAARAAIDRALTLRRELHDAEDLTFISAQALSAWIALRSGNLAVYRPATRSALASFSTHWTPPHPLASTAILNLVLSVGCEVSPPR